RLMYYTALEGYLKAFLRLKGVSGSELARRELGHRYCCLLERSKQCDLTLGEQDYRILYFLSSSDERERVRYIETGAATWTSVEALDGACVSIREQICAHLKMADLPVRLLDADHDPFEK